jgi:hypothetical protein
MQKKNIKDKKVTRPNPACPKPCLLSTAVGRLPTEKFFQHSCAILLMWRNLQPKENYPII